MYGIVSNLPLAGALLLAVSAELGASAPVGPLVPLGVDRALLDLALAAREQVRLLVVAGHAAVLRLANDLHER